MEKIIQNFEELVIEWISVSTIDSCGCGVEFYYQCQDQHILIGFIDGFGWDRELREFIGFRRGTETNCVRIYRLTPDSWQWGKLLANSKGILEDLKECVYIMLKGEKGHGKVKGDIHARFNV